MKGKIAKILGVSLVLALVLSLSLVVAVPVAADPEETGTWFAPGAGGDAQWVTGETHTGAYTPKLTCVTNALITYVYFVPDEGTTVSGLASITASPEWSYWYKLDGAIGHGVELELKFTDPDSDGFVEITVFAGSSDFTGDSEWYKRDVLASSGDCVFYGSDPTDGTAFNSEGPEGDGFQTLAEMLTLINAETEMMAGGDTADDWELTRVGMQLCTVQNAWVDEVTIDGTTYDLEAIILDMAYYSVGDTVEVTVPNFNVNTDPIRVNPVTAEEDGADADWWQVTVTSDSDSLGIVVDIEETGADTGVFTGSFTTVGTPQAEEDELYVQDGDAIKVGYTGDWGATEQILTAYTLAEVDDTIPTITVVSPTDGQQISNRKPDISASYTDGTAGIDEDSVEMFLNGEEVDATATTSGVTYTPTEDLVDGSYDVTVNVSDNAGNEATEIWSFRIVSWLDGSPVTGSGPDLDELDTVGVAVSGATPDTSEITVGRYASNPEPDAPPTFSLIENGFFDVQVTGADTATLIVIKFADPEITAETTAYVWGETEGAWLECSDQGYNSVDEYLWVKVRTDTIPSIAELGGTPFAISGEAAVDILAYYRGLGEDPNVVETTDLLQAGNDWANEVVPSGFTEPISTTQLLTLANEWAATD